MRKLIFSLIFAVAGIVAAGQTVQRGIVQEYNEAAPKTALPGVELRVYPAQSTVSDADGRFALEFLTLNPGERINVRRIEKDGYEIFNKDALEQWNLSPDNTFSIVMCRSDRFKHLKDIYYANSEERYSRQYRNAAASLRRLRDENRIRQQEFADSLRKIEDLYARQLENLDNYVDRFARIDLSEISATEQEIIALVQEGKIDEAIARYDDLDIKNRLLTNIERRNEVRSAITQLQAADTALTASRDSLYAMASRQIQTLQLAGDYRNNAKILDLYRTIADADTTNVEWLLKTGNFLSVSIGDYNQARRYMESALNNLLRQDNPDELLLALCYNNLGTVYESLGEYAIAAENYDKALQIRLRVLGTRHPLVATSYNNLGSALCSQGYYSQAEEYFNKALEIRLELLGPEHPDVATSYYSLGLLYFDKGDVAKAEEFLNKALEIRLRCFGPDDVKVATSYNSLGTLYGHKRQSAKAIEYFNKGLEIISKIYGPKHPDVAVYYHNIGNVYSQEGDYTKSAEYFRKAIDIRLQYLQPYQMTESRAEAGLAQGIQYYKEGNYKRAKDCLGVAISVLERRHPDDFQTWDAIHLAYLQSLIWCAERGIAAATEISDFMADKLYIGRVLDGDTAASRHGLSGDYYVLELSGWNFLNDYDLRKSFEALDGQPKSLVLMQGDKINRYNFENRLGMNFLLRKVTPEEKARVVEAYRRWKENNGLNQ